MAAGDVVPLDAVIVHVVEDGEALSTGLGLRAAAAARGPEAAAPVVAAGDALRPAVLPLQSAAVTARRFVPNFSTVSKVHF